MVDRSLGTSISSRGTDNNAMNRSRENLPVTISADWLCQLYPLRSYLRVARRGSIIADVIKLGLMRFTIWQLGCGITLICLLLVNLTLLLQVQRERKSKDKAVVERSRITEAQMYILILERTEELTEKDKTEAGRLAWIMAIDTEIGRSRIGANWTTNGHMSRAVCSIILALIAQKAFLNLCAMIQI